jgi:TonB-linked SusC/RagA family outer membrane protein
MKRKLMLFLACLFIGIGLATAQISKVTGLVTSEDDGLPVVGASVLVKGTTVGTVTDMDGKFTLSNVPSTAKILVVSYIGMQSKEVGIKENLVISLSSDTELLDEVTVVAYGAAKKSSLTGSVATVKSDALEKTSVSSFEKALQGQTAGVQIESTSGAPGAVSQVRIRGIGSMSASSSPLYVIDGVAISSTNLSKVANEDSYGTSANPLASLNPNDIESITVLKDASAASLYGSRAANGVILITTKKGKSGEAKIDFKAQWSASKLPSSGYNLMNSTDHYKLYYQGFYTQNIENGMDSSAASLAANQSVRAMYGGFNPFNVENPFSGEGTLVSGAKAMIDTDYLDALFRTATTQQYDLSVSGGTDKSKYFISLGYLDQEGIGVGSDMTRYSARINLDTKIKPWADFGITSNLSANTQNTPPGGGGGASPLTNAFYIPSAVPIYDLDSNFNKTYDEAGNVQYNWTNPVFNDMNALALTDMDIYRTKTYRALVSPYLDLNIYGVHWKTSFSYDYMHLDEMRWYNPEHGNGAACEGRLSKYNILNLTSTLTSTLNYSFSLNDVHHIGLMAGYEAYNNRYSYSLGHATGFSDSSLIELSMASTPYEVKSKTDKERMVSYFGRVNYDFDNKYFASFSLRSDGSSRFAPGHQWGTFWSAGLNWRVSEEKFMKDVTWVNDLKLRASYGTSGNKQSDYLYGYQGLYSSGSNYNGANGIVHSQLPNDELSWEKSKNFNVGVDFELFNVLSGSVEYYSKSSSALLLEKPLAPSTGFESTISNLGGMRNRGIEIELHSNNLKSKTFGWNTDFNISFNSNKITSYPQEEEVVGTKIRTVGYSIYEFYLKEWAGVDPTNGDPLWYKDVKDEDGNPTGERTTTNKYSEADKYKLGSALPSATGGLTNTFSFKGLELSVLFTYGFGGKVYDAYEAYLMNDGNKTGYQAIIEQADAWTPTNTNASCPKFVPNNSNNSNATSSRYLHDADYIKLKNISLSYNLPKSLTKKAMIDNVRIFVSADNLKVWNLDGSFKGYDVELGGVSGVLDGAGTVPLTRTFTAGLNLTF